MKQIQNNKENKKIEWMLKIGNHLLDKVSDDDNEADKIEEWKQKGIYDYACVAQSINDAEAFHENGTINFLSDSWSHWAGFAKRNGDIGKIDKSYIDFDELAELERDECPIGEDGTYNEGYGSD